MFAVEPFADPIKNLENRQKSMWISSTHLVVQIQKSGVTLTDLTSSNGTIINEERLSPLVSTLLQTDDIIDVAGVLEMKCSIHSDDDGRVYAAELRRQSNCEWRRYALAPAGIGATQDDPTTVIPLDAKAALAKWRIAWTSTGLALDTRADANVTVLTTMPIPSREHQIGQRHMMVRGDKILVDGQIVASIETIAVR